MTGKTQTKRKPKSKATTRQTSGAGYDFEDLTAAWLMVKMLRGVVMPGIETSAVELQWQTDALGWEKIDDLLVKCRGKNSELRNLAISCKSNMQVTTSGLPSNFVIAAWKLFRKSAPFQKERDRIALVQRGKHQTFFPVWSDLKGWCSAGDTEPTIAKINASNKHRKIFYSIKTPENSDLNFTDEDTINLIRHLDIIPLDFQLEPSDHKANSLAYCRDILQDGSENTANDLWDKLVTTAKKKRIPGGTLPFQELWQELVKNHNLKNHPDFASSWNAIERITEDYKNLIEITLPTGFSVTRELLENNLIGHLNSGLICAVYGSSGCGKSAFVKSALDRRFSGWQQIWFSPEDLDSALSERARSGLNILHPLNDVLCGTNHNKNIIVIDAAERINPECEKRTKQLISNLLSGSDKKIPEWRIIIIGQTEAWIAGKLQALSGALKLNSVEVPSLNPSEVRQALQSSPRLSWLSTNNDAVIALGNLKTLAWVMQAEFAFPGDEIDKFSIPTIADRLWLYWTNDKTKLQNLLIKLAEREALFERSFAISELDLDASEALDESPEQFPLRKNKKTNRYEFEHDLAADLARFQKLKEIKDNIDKWGFFASNPLWHNALRMLGQLLLREIAGDKTMWDLAFESAEKSKDKNPLAGDILLDSLCLDPSAEYCLAQRSNMLLSDNGARLNRLLKRFHHIATVPDVPEEFLKIDPSLRLYFEDSHRVPVYGRWPQIVRFLASHKQKVADLISPVVARFCETWLNKTPLNLAPGEPMPFRRELAEIAIATARALQLAQEKRIIFLDDSEKPIYSAAFSAISDIPDEVIEWALEMARRKPLRQDIVEALSVFNEQKRKEEVERLRTDKAYRERIDRLHSSAISFSGYQDLPPWPLGPQGRVEQDFRKYCLQPLSLARLMSMHPKVASEILLAMIIDDSPKEEYSGGLRLDEELGLEYNNSGYPTIYWKSPFFQFLQKNSNVALDTIVSLVNFCMERWEENNKRVPHIEITLRDNRKLIFKGNSRVFAWSQENSSSNGQLFCALAALERWLCMEIDKGVDITPAINTLLDHTKSVAVIGVLINVGKYKPELFTHILQPILGAHELYVSDRHRVENSGYFFDSLAWVREGEKVFEMAKEWIFAPYRKKTLLELASELLKNHVETANFIRDSAQKWELPSDSKSALELRILKAQLNRDNYKPVKDEKSGKTLLWFHCPDELRRDINEFQEENNQKLQTVILPHECEKILQASEMLSEHEAEILSMALNKLPTEEDKEVFQAGRVAVASALSVKASAWLIERPALARVVDSIISEVIADIDDTLESLLSPDRFMRNPSLKFAAHVVTRKWIEDETRIGQWDSSVLRILTSHDAEAVFILMDAAYRNRDRLGNRWWRLLQISIFWAGLCQLAPGFRENESGAIQQRWGRWLHWLRSRKLDSPSAMELFDPISIANRVDRLKRLRIKRLFGVDAEGRLKYYRRQFSCLDTHNLEQTFAWLLDDRNQFANNDKDVRFLTIKLWEFEVWRKRKDEECDDEKDELPSNLGWKLIRKLAKLTLFAPKDEAVSLWKPVLSLGVDGHHAIEHFSDVLFLEVVRVQNENVLSQLWREMIEFALSSSNWSPDKRWYKGEQMFRHILGFHSIAFADFEKAKAIVFDLKDLYRQWAEGHLTRDEDNVAAFARFLSSKAGAAIRLDGLLWIKKSFTLPNKTYWHREKTGNSLIQLLDLIVSQETQRISSDPSLRDSLLGVAAHLVSKQVDVALSLQERIRQIH